MTKKKVTEAGLRRLLDRYREAEALAQKAYALDHYGAGTRKAFQFAGRRHKAFHKAAGELFIWPNHYTGIANFIATHPEVK